MKRFDPVKHGLDQEPPCGIILGEPDEVYHARPNCLSSSKLKTFRKRRLEYHARHIEHSLPQEKRESFALTFGSAAHCMILEGEEAFKARYHVVPAGAPERPARREADYQKISKDLREKLDYWEPLLVEAEAGGYELINSDQEARARLLYHRCLNNRVISLMLLESVPEVTFRINLGWTYLQVRADGFVPTMSEELAECLKHACSHWSQAPRFYPGESAVLDLKTCASLHPEDIASFQRSYSKLDYWLQDALYSETIPALTNKRVGAFVWGAIERTPPHDVAPFMGTPEQSALYVDELSRLLDSLESAHKNGLWHGFSQRLIQPIDLPAWGVRELERKKELACS